MKTLKIEIPKGYQVDEEKSTFTNIVFKPISTEYIDLGLPSGTLWADTNEEGYYSYDEAIDTFGKDNLPKLTDFVELYDYCKWKWDDKSKSMIIIGPNGRHIKLPASGYRSYSSGGLRDVGDYGDYWSVTPLGNSAYSLRFSSNGFVYPSLNFDRASGYAVRKIKRK